jgi:hypothetical protein
MLPHYYPDLPVVSSDLMALARHRNQEIRGGQHGLGLT